MTADRELQSKETEINQQIEQEFAAVALIYLTSHAAS
jgi:hypothetical protein